MAEINDAIPKMINKAVAAAVKLSRRRPTGLYKGAPSAQHRTGDL